MADRDAITCQQVVELVTDYLEGALSAERRRAPRGSTSALCDGCRCYLDQVRITIAAGRPHRRDTTCPDRAARHRLLAAFRDRQRL